MDSSEKTEIQIKFANWDKWLGAAWNLYSTKGWLLNFTNSDGEINNMIAPVRSMIGDTLSVGAYYNYELVEMFEIVLD